MASVCSATSMALRAHFSPASKSGTSMTLCDAEAVRDRQLGAGPEPLEAGDGQVDLAFRLLLVAQQPAEAAEPASRVEGLPLGADRLGQRDRLLLQLRRGLDLAEQVALLGGCLDHLGALARIVDEGVGRVGEPAEAPRGWR